MLERSTKALRFNSTKYVASAWRQNDGRHINGLLCMASSLYCTLQAVILILTLQVEFQRPNLLLYTLVGAFDHFGPVAHIYSGSYQEVNLLTPLQTSIRFIPMVIAGLFTNLMGGWMMNWFPGQPLMLGGLVGNLVRKFCSFHAFLSRALTNIVLRLHP